MSSRKAPKQVPLVAHTMGGGSEWTDAKGVERVFVQCMCGREFRGRREDTWWRYSRHCARENFYVARWAQWAQRAEPQRQDRDRDRRGTRRHD
jgi:hypothetical protein